MTLTQLERYMISEIENLHIRIDSIAESLGGQMQEIIDYLKLKTDQHEQRFDVHTGQIEALNKRLSSIEP